jgi:hypothetical protein
MDKRIGYVLLFCGFSLLAAAPVMLWQMFYGAMQPPQAFVSESLLTLNMASGMAVTVPLPPHLNQAANFGLGALLMFFIAGVGGKIGSLGVRLINKPAAAAKPPSQP